VQQVAKRAHALDMPAPAAGGRRPLDALVA
jgi:hypothetical protein